MRIRPPILLYGSTAALSVCILALVMKLWQADWTIPLGPLAPDLFFHSGLIKGMLENGWYFSNGHLGAPGQLMLLDFPYGPNLHMALIKGLSLLSGNYATILNIYFALAFPLIALTALFSLRRFGIGAAPAMLASLLFTFLPYHFMRGENHIFYAAYFMAPLIGMVVLYLCRGELIEWTGRPWWKNSRFLAAVAICSLAAFDLPYYSYFAVFFCVVGGVYAAIQKRQGVHLAAASLLVGSIFVSSALNTGPALIHKWRNGGNSQVAARGAAESEVFALKVVQLVLPVTDHRLPALAMLKQRYNQSAPLVNENDTASLGMVGAIGFLLLLGTLVARRLVEEKWPLLGELSLLNLTAILVGTLGGIGSIIAFTLAPMVRSYNRISIYIGYFSLFAVALSIDHAVRRSARGKWMQWPLCGALLVFGLWDQTTAQFVPPYEEIRNEFRSDREFVGGIEQALPAGSMVFQLPYLSFPESAPVFGMADYSHLRGYLHSRTLRWSYGAMRGRPTDEWQKQVCAKPPLEMVESLVLRGFRGIYMDRYGYPGGKGIEADLRQSLGEPALESKNKRLVFFNLQPFEEKLRASMPAEKWLQLQNQARDQITLIWEPGFYGLETDPQRQWRWCAARGTLVVYNPALRTQKMEIATRLVVAQEGDANVWIKGLFSDHVKVGRAGVSYRRVFEVPPGTHQLQFSCDGKRAIAKDDPRDLVFLMEDFHYGGIPQGKP